MPPPDAHAGTCALEPAGAATDDPLAPAPPPAPPPAQCPRPPGSGAPRPALEEESSAPLPRQAGPAPRPAGPAQHPCSPLALAVQFGEAPYDPPWSPGDLLTARRRRRGPVAGCLGAASGPPSLAHHFLSRGEINLQVSSAVEGLISHSLGLELLDGFVRGKLFVVFRADGLCFEMLHLGMDRSVPRRK